MSYCTDKLVIDRHTHAHTHTQATTIPEVQNWPRVKMIKHADFMFQKNEHVRYVSDCGLLRSYINVEGWQTNSWMKTQTNERTGGHIHSIKPYKATDRVCTQVTLELIHSRLLSASSHTRSFHHWSRSYIDPRLWHPGEINLSAWMATD